MVVAGVDERGRPINDSPSSEASHLLQHMAARAVMVPVFALNLKSAALWLWRPKSAVPVLVVSSAIPDDGGSHQAVLQECWYFASRDYDAVMHNVCHVELLGICPPRSSLIFADVV